MELKFNLKTTSLEKLTDALERIAGTSGVISMESSLKSLPKSVSTAAKQAM